MDSTNTNGIKHIFVMSSDAETNRGEAFYGVALAKQLKKDHGENVVIHFFKHSGVQAERPNSQILPTTIAKYAKHVPVIPSEQLTTAIEGIGVNDSVLILGAGGSTLNSVAGLKDAIAEKTDAIEAGWMTHKPETAEQVQLLADQQITYIGPKSSIPALHALNPEAAARVKVVATEGVPTGATHSTTKSDKNRFFKKSSTGRAFASHVFPKNKPAKPFISVIGNAGFGPKTGDDRVIITPEEAYQHGRNLGYDAKAGTALLFGSPGPRLEDDDNENKRRVGAHAERPDDAFVRGYLESQLEKGAVPAVFIDRFNDPKDIKRNKKGKIMRDAKGNPLYIKTNGANAIINLSHEPNNVMTIINAEGEGLKAMSIELANMRNVYTIDSSAIYTDKSGARVESNRFFEKKGIVVLSSVPGKKGLQGYEKKNAVDADAAFNPSQDPAVAALHAFGMVNRNLLLKNVIKEFWNNKEIVINVSKFYTPDGKLVESVTKAAIANEKLGKKADLRSAFCTIKKTITDEKVDTQIYSGARSTNLSDNELMEASIHVMRATQPQKARRPAAA